MSHPHLDRRIRLALEMVARHLAQKSYLFTAYDVSRILQAYGVRERHNHMKHVVHDMVENGQLGYHYSRTLQDVGAPVQANVFHPDSANAEEYQTLDPRAVLSELEADANAMAKLNDAVAVALSPGILSALSQPRGGVRRPDGSRVKSLDRLDRLRIPASLLREVGAVAGDTVYVALNTVSGAVQVALATMTGAREYKVDRYTNIRIKLRGNYGNDYEIKVDQGQVIAAPAP